MPTLLLNKTEVGTCIDLDEVLAAVESGYASFCSGRCNISKISCT